MHTNFCWENSWEASGLKDRLLTWDLRRVYLSSYGVMKMYWGVEVLLHTFLFSAVDGCE
jgi:hypothetical protein